VFEPFRMLLKSPRTSIAGPGTGLGPAAAGKFERGASDGEAE
jgi:hypothetical protein